MYNDDNDVIVISDLYDEYKDISNEDHFKYELILENIVVETKISNDEKIKELVIFDIIKENILWKNMLLKMPALRV